jgi:hypothetical protein
MVQIRTPLRLPLDREVAGGPFSGETSACIRGLDRPLQLAWPDARHQASSQSSLQHGARVVPRAAFAPSPALALCPATSRSATSPRRRGSVSLEMWLARGRPPVPSSTSPSFPGPPRAVLMTVASLHSALCTEPQPGRPLFPAD